METKFTKGTWSVTGQFRLDVEGGYITTQLSGSLDSTVLEREANAHLIAAAPDMYAMLKGMYETLCLIGDDGEEANEINELLKKARGE